MIKRQQGHLYRSFNREWIILKHSYGCAKISWIIIVVKIYIFTELLCDADHPDTRHFIVIITIITAYAFYPAIMASHQQNKQLCQRNGII